MSDEGAAPSVPVEEVPAEEVPAENAEGEVAEGQEEGAEAAAVEEEEEEPVEDVLSEEDILKRMWQVELDEEDSGLQGIFISSDKYGDYGLGPENGCAKDDLFPYAQVSVEFALDDIQKKAFASGFKEHEKTIKKLPSANVTQLLLINDRNKLFGENFVYCKTLAAYERETEKIEEHRQRVQDEYEEEKAAAAAAAAALAAGAVGEDGQLIIEDVIPPEDESIVVQDEPLIPQPYQSESMHETAVEVDKFNCEPTRPYISVRIHRKLENFGAPCKFNDVTQEIANFRNQKDPNFALRRKELDMGVQAVKDTCTQSSNTIWNRPQNAAIQYESKDFLDLATPESEQVDKLSTFVTKVQAMVEDALSQNETIDIFQNEFDQLGEEELGFSSKTTSDIKEVRNFHDVTYTKNKKIECVSWVPESSMMLAASCVENSTYDDRLDNINAASTAHILLWSFHDSLAPHAVLLSPWEVDSFTFHPTDKHYLVAGLSSGQIAFWKLSDYELGTVKNMGKTVADDDKASTPKVNYKILSTIDDAHKKAVTALEWLPGNIEIERRGKASLREDLDTPTCYLLTASGDGQVMIWDFNAALENINDSDYQWKPVHKIQLTRFDSGTEMSLCQLLYCENAILLGRQLEDKPKDKILTQFWATTEEGELCLGDWGAKGDEDRKPEYCKSLLGVSKTFRPMVALQRSPFFKEIIMIATDYAVYLWKENMDSHVFSIFISQSYYTCAAWSPTRPGVIFLGRNDGVLEIWDFSDQSHKPSLHHTVSSSGISSIQFLPPACVNNLTDEQGQLAVGDEQGHLHVLRLPKSLMRMVQGKEEEAMNNLFAREADRVHYFSDKKAELSAQREEKDRERDRQMAAREEEQFNTEKKATVGEQLAAQDDAAEKEYKDLEQKFLSEIGVVKN